MPKQEEKLGITVKKSDDFSEWYNEVVIKSDLAEHSPIKGFMVIKPRGYAVWEKIQDFFDKNIKKLGVRNAYFPLLIPEKFFKKEAEHAKGFAPELAWVMDEEQREKYLVPFAKDDTCLLSIAQTEPGSGTDNTFPYHGVEGGIKLSAVKQGSEWVLNGTKHFIACAALAKIFIVIARTDPNAPAPKGATQFLMWRDTPGFKVGRTHGKVGGALLMNAEIVLENVRIPESDILMGINEGFSDKARHYGRGAPMVATFGLGIARGAYEEALSYARETVQGGKPLIKHDAIAMRLADMLTLIEATRSAIWKAAWASDNREYYIQRDAAIGSYFSTVCARTVCENAMQIFGRDGYMRNMPAEKYLRDALMTYHINNTVDVRLLKIGRSLTGKTVSTL